MSLITSLLPASHVLVDLPAANRRDVFEQVAALLEGKTGIKRGVILDSLLVRERLGSTGLGQGIAIPHGRVRGLREATGAFVRTREPIEFDAPDDRPVNLVFVLLVPEKSTDVHLEILSELAEMFSSREQRARLLSAGDSLEVQRLIASWQAKPAAAR
jgi:PTS system nitrogen regulatory IIA component